MLLVIVGIDLLMNCLYSHVKISLKSLMKGVQTNGGEFEDDDLEEIVSNVVNGNSHN